MVDNANGIGKDGGHFQRSQIELNNIVHENIIMPNDRLWPT